LPDGADAYPAYEILTLCRVALRLSGLQNPHPCRVALTLIRPTKPSPFAGWRCAYPAYKILGIAG